MDPVCATKACARVTVACVISRGGPSVDQRIVLVPFTRSAQLRKTSAAWKKSSPSGIEGNRRSKAATLSAQVVVVTTSVRFVVHSRRKRSRESVIGGKISDVAVG